MSEAESSNGRAVAVPSASEELSSLLGSRKAQALEEQAWSVVPDLFHSLVSYKRPVLMEIACGPNSVLSEQVQKRMGRESAAVRCSIWNGCDLSTKEGLRHVLDRIRQERPANVWVSPPCGPYSPIQNLNQRSEAQKQELQAKRREAMKIYLGAACVVHLCVQLGIHVTWELSERCQAWRLPLLTGLAQKYGLYKAVTKGCAVNLRDDQGSLMQKGWRVMTSLKRLAETLDLPCRCPQNYKHGICEGNNTERSAFYTPEYSRRVARVLCRELGHEDVMQECKGHTKLPVLFGDGEFCTCGESCDPRISTCSNCLRGRGDLEAGDPVSPKQALKRDERPKESGFRVSCGVGGIEESGAELQQVLANSPEVSLGEQAWVLKQRESWKGPLKNQGNQRHEEIKRKLYRLHAATGHGSVRHMVEALRRRNADPLVLELARKFTCSICQERKQMVPRSLASLEPLPEKFHTVSADIGHWLHPHTGEHHNFMVILDEGSRFRLAKVLTKGSKQTPNAATCLQFLSEGWIQTFGKPKVLRLDPAGSFRSQQVEGFCDRHGVFLDIIPGEAHWQIGATEQAVQGLKQLLGKLCDAEPHSPVEELLSVAVATFNHREIVRGFSPAQHVLGQNPDSTGQHVQGLQGLDTGPILNNSVEELRRTAYLRAEAEKALADWQAQQRINRAMSSRARPQHPYQPETWCTSGERRRRGARIVYQEPAKGGSWVQRESWRWNPARMPRGPPVEATPSGVCEDVPC